MTVSKSRTQVPKEARITQILRILKSLQVKPLSRRMLSKELDVYLCSICSDVHRLLENGRCEVYKMDYCKITGKLVEYLTTDPELFPSRDQLKLDL